MAPGGLRALLVGVALAACAAITSPDRDGPRPRAKAPPPSPLTDPEPRLPEPEATPPTTPIRNLRVDPATMHVIWDVVGGAGGGDKFLCRKGEHGPTLRAHTKPRPYCDFPSSLSICKDTDVIVFPEGRRDQAARIRFRPRDANPGSAPRDLRCAVREVDAVTPTLAMTCRWRRGPTAHADLRYRMFWRDARLRPDHDLECARPEADLDSEGGERCTVTLDPGRDPVTLVIVTVNASHGGGAASGGVAGAAVVACRDIPVDLVQAEELAPPTLTGVCNGSEARMSWAVRSHFHHKFEFTLQINRSSHAEPQFVQVQDKHFEILNARALSIRVQASWAEGLRVSGWSPALRLACDPATPAEAKSAMMAAWLAAGTGMTFLLLLLLLWRKSLLARLCPPIPRMRVPVGSTMAAMTLGETVAWAVGAEDCEVTRVTEA